MPNLEGLVDWLIGKAKPDPPDEGGAGASEEPEGDSAQGAPKPSRTPEPEPNRPPDGSGVGNGAASSGQQEERTADYQPLLFAPAARKRLPLILDSLPIPLPQTDEPDSPPMTPVESDAVSEDEQADAQQVPVLDESEMGSAPAQVPDEGISGHRCSVIIGDTEGDLETLQRNLSLIGVLLDNGDLNTSMPDGCHLELVDEGDALRKQAPNGIYMDYLRMIAQCLPDHLEVRTLAGNHELERLREGFTRQQVKTMKSYSLEPEKLLEALRNLDIFHFDPPMLYLHGYPTIGFMHCLLRELLDNDGVSAGLNERFRKDIRKGPKGIDEWRYLRDSKSRMLLHDVGDASSYYHQHGEELAVICGRIGIHTIVIGHRPCSTRMQEVLVLPSTGKKKARKATARMQDELAELIQAGEPIVVEGSWPNKGVVILRNDVLGDGNQNRYGMLLVRRGAERVEMLTINGRHHDAQRTRAFLWGGVEEIQRRGVRPRN